jgi:hypothetical protein
MNSLRFTAALKAAGIHLLVSVLVAAIAAALVFGIWYPFPYRDMMGGRELFILVIAVDVVCGPMLTLVLFNPSKPRAELARDLGLVAVIQLAALIYGLYVVMVARPIYMVFEVDRFNAISAIDVDEADVSQAKAPWNQLPWLGPKAIAAREPKDGDEKLKSLDLSMAGKEPSVRPDWWQELQESKDLVLKRAKPLSVLLKKYADKPQDLARIEKAIEESGKPLDTLRWLPLTSKRTKDWVALIDAQTTVPLAYASVDGF